MFMPMQKANCPKNSLRMADVGELHQPWGLIKKGKQNLHNMIIPPVAYTNNALAATGLFKHWHGEAPPLRLAPPILPLLPPLLTRSRLPPPSVLPPPLELQEGLVCMWSTPDWYV